MADGAPSALVIAELFHLGNPLLALLQHFMALHPEVVMDNLGAKAMPEQLPRASFTQSPAITAKRGTHTTTMGYHPVFFPALSATTVSLLNSLANRVKPTLQ